MRAIFQESGNLPVVMHLLNNLDSHSDTMQLAIFKNLETVFCKTAHSKNKSPQ